MATRAKRGEWKEKVKERNKFKYKGKREYRCSTLKSWSMRVGCMGKERIKWGYRGEICKVGGKSPFQKFHKTFGNWGRVASGI